MSNEDSDCGGYKLKSVKECGKVLNRQRKQIYSDPPSASSKSQYETAYQKKSAAEMNQKKNEKRKEINAWMILGGVPEFRPFGAARRNRKKQKLIKQEISLSVKSNRSDFESYLNPLNSGDDVDVKDKIFFSTSSLALRPTLEARRKQKLECMNALKEFEHCLRNEKMCAAGFERLLVNSIKGTE
mmetsp:Transcript_16963/g.19193  ORF Transcript_16963/g.19193 Transcript_16963/m.19193 type:complete len:185 (-) Transcript_16963:253-807(-)|eukprot:CAMPEP_0204849796 /NCGR_PEP_ID=MMETSP1347-20130617/6852_1 /ASSEMBLY_ACC=CAM_ASM_000690 /TAXON_ID=215587 /ORGANISM="Aplanochytrium stocchinoi, Strain GSBS06" /LENGTH=184 /DNA_ID=CAMNT_0051992309 /DNA_START=81 /DNA_END=635 /DNA_ORIENTATION=+